MCSICALRFNSSDVMEVDHVVPKAQGGKNVKSNLQLLHAHCHDRKELL